MPKLTVSQPAATGEKGTVAGLTKAMEYNTEGADYAGAWTAVTGAGQKFDAGTYYIRLAETAYNMASPAEKVTVSAYKAPVYKVIEGAGSSFRHGSDGSLTFRADGDLTKFTGLKVDGEAVDETSYTKWRGSTYVRLTSAYLHTLSAGGHTVTFLFTDGTCEADFTVAAAPVTGDHGHAAVWSMTALAAVCGAAYVVRCHRKKTARNG